MRGNPWKPYPRPSAQWVKMPHFMHTGSSPEIIEGFEWLPALVCRMCGSGAAHGDTMLCRSCRYGPADHRGRGWQELRGLRIAPGPAPTVPIAIRAARLRLPPRPDLEVFV